MFGRRAKVVIGKENQLGISIEDLRIKFDVTKTITDPNTCDIEIYNLNDNSRNSISKLDNILELSAGYEDETIEVIFIGNVVSTHTIYPIPEIITNISAEDGEKELTSSRVAMSFTEGTNIKTIYKELLNKIPLGLRSKFSLIPIPDKKFPNAFSFMGSAKNALNQLSKSVGLTWSVQNREIKIYPEDGNDSTVAIQLNSNTGLLTSPEKIKIKRKVKKGKDYEIDGWRVRSLLQPFAEPGGTVIIKSRDIDNNPFTIDKVIHSGDNTESDFVSIMEVYK